MKKNILLLALLMLSFLAAIAQVDLTKKIATDAQVKIGKLENGLTYYIRHNAMPPNRLEMRLVVNAGSILEDDEQQGLAHFAEHMAFNGTKNFSKSALVDFLERAGVRFGADLNAYTSFDETVYMLQLPTDRKGLVDSAFMVLEDWAHQVSFDAEEIDKERGVIREEWRLGQGAEDRMRKSYFPVIFSGSLYAQRLPIGTLGVIDTASYETLRRFYREWYRPNLQAVIVVGDIDIQLAEEKILQHFAHIKNPDNARERAIFKVPGNKAPLVAIATDKEATSTVLRLLYKHDKQPTETYADYKRNLMQSLYSGMIMNRFREINQKPESPFITASSFYGGFMGRAIDAYNSFASIKENRIEDAIISLVKENERVRKHGFTPTELERQKTTILTNLEKRLREADKTNSSSFVWEYSSHFLNKSPIPGIQTELEMARQLLPLITISEMNALAPKWITEENMVVVLTAPETDNIKVPSEKRILELIAQAKAAEVAPYVDSFTDEPLMSAKLTPAKVLKTKNLPQVGVTEYELSNGVKVVLKPTDFKNDEILLSAFGWGGSSLFDDEMAFAANNIVRAVAASGIGNFSQVDLGKKLTGQTVNVQPFIENVRQGFRGSVSPKDFETMLQLIYLHFQGARRDADAFEAFRSQLSNQFRFMRSNPQAVFSDTLNKLANNQSKRAVLIPNEQHLASLTPENVYGMYDRLFGNANGYTFIFTGNVDESFLPLITSYLGSLPVKKQPEKWVNRDPGFPAGITDAKVFAGTENQSMVAIMLSNTFNWNETDRLQMSMLMRAFNIKLRESMREELGGVYGVGARHSVSQFPETKVNITVNWGTNPGLVDTLSKTVFHEMRQLMANGPTNDDLAKVKETTVRERETNDRQNNFWNQYLDFSYFNNSPLLSFEDFRKTVQAVNPAELKTIANKYFTPDQYLRLVLYPVEMREE